MLRGLQASSSGCRRRSATPPSISTGCASPSAATAPRSAACSGAASAAASCCARPTQQPATSIQIYPEGTSGGGRLRRQHRLRLGLRLPAARHLDDHARRARSASRTVTLTIDAAPVVNVTRPRCRGRPRLRDHGHRRRVGSHQRRRTCTATTPASPHHERDLRRERARRRHPRRQLRQRLRQRHLSRSVRAVHRRRLRLRAAGHRRKHLPSPVLHARLRPSGADGRPGAQRHLGRRGARRVGDAPTAPAHAVHASRRTSSSSTAARHLLDGSPTFTDTTDARARRSPRCGRATSAPSASTSTKRAARAFRLSNVKLAADDEPNGNGFFTIRWRIADATFSPASPTPTAATRPSRSTTTPISTRRTKTLIASGINGASGQSLLELAGLAPGVYYVYAQITDGAGNTQGRYSTGPVRSRAAIPAADRQQQQRPRRRVGGQPRASRTRARTTTATASPTCRSIRPARIRASRTRGPWRKARPASSPSASRWPTRIDARPTSAHVPAAGAEPADHPRLLAAAVRPPDHQRQRDRRPATADVSTVVNSTPAASSPSARCSGATSSTAATPARRSSARARSGISRRARPTASSRRSSCWPTRPARRRTST